METKAISIQDYIRRQGAIDEETAQAYIAQIDAQLHRLHEQRHICHLDVRPATIIICDYGIVKLKDSPMSESFTEEGKATDMRDLMAVKQYLITGKKTEDAVPDDLPMEKSKLKDSRQPSRNAQNPTGSSRSYQNNVWIMAVTAIIVCGAFLIFFLSRSGREHTDRKAFADYTYQGFLKKGIPHGKGIARYTDGRIYEGNFSHGKRKDSNATFVYANGNKFTGTFAADTIQKGRVMLSSGDYYFDGDFSHGKPYNGYWYSSDSHRKVEQVKNGKEIIL